jgi:hypothetical protein
MGVLRVEGMVARPTMILEIPLTDGGSLAVFASDPPGAQPAGRFDIQRGEETLEEMLTKVRPAADAILAAFRGLTARPDGVTVEFGLQFTGKVGAVLVSADAQATYRVTLKWQALPADSG